MIAVSDLELVYGASVRALRGVSFAVEPGGAVAILGSNGAGKTSLLRALSGNLRRHRATISGTVTLDGRRIDGMSTAEIVRKGVVQVPEGRRVFERMTVEDNLTVGATAATASRGRQGLGEVYEMFPILAQRRRQHAGLLSGGEQQMLAIGRALMVRPRVLMLDEPSLGLAPAVIGVIGEIITRIHATGTTLILVEQNTTMGLSVADQALVLDQGRVALHGPTNDPNLIREIQSLYLGAQGERTLATAQAAKVDRRSLSRWARELRN